MLLSGVSGRTARHVTKKQLSFPDGFHLGSFHGSADCESIIHADKHTTAMFCSMLVAWNYIHPPKRRARFHHCASIITASSLIDASSARIFQTYIFFHLSLPNLNSGTPNPEKINATHFESRLDPHAHSALVSTTDTARIGLQNSKMSLSLKQFHCWNVRAVFVLIIGSTLITSPRKSDFDNKAFQNNAKKSKTNIANIVKPRKKLFHCGYFFRPLISTIFPDFDLQDNFFQDVNHSFTDLIIVGMHGECIPGMTVQQSYVYIQKNFRGKALMVNGESFGNVLKEYNPNINLYQIGGDVEDTERTLMVYYCAIVLFCNLPISSIDIITGQSSRPTWNGKQNKLIYFYSHCVKYRQNAVLELAEFIHTDVPLNHCSVDHDNVSFVNLDEFFPEAGIALHQSGHVDNWKLYRNYKYCLVMENTNARGYITEKILYAFSGGCLPIYWGTEEVFNVFNRNAFLYYQPGLTANQIRILEENHTAYEEYMASPILANGNETLKHFFSLRDDVGDGVLKNRIRSMLGIVET